MPLSNAHEKLKAAVRILATRPSNIQKRLEEAQRQELGYIKIEDAPEYAQDDIRQVVERLSVGQPPLSDEKAIQIAEKILSLEYQLR